MTCKACGSDTRRQFTSEIAIHFPEDINKPHVLVFPELSVCLDCGNAEFRVPETELHVLAKDHAAAAG